MARLKSTTRRASDEFAEELRNDPAISKKLQHLGLLYILDDLIDERVAKGEARRVLVRGKPGVHIIRKAKKRARA